MGCVAARGMSPVPSPTRRDGAMPHSGAEDTGTPTGFRAWVARSRGREEPTRCRARARYARLVGENPRRRGLETGLRRCGTDHHGGRRIAVRAGEPATCMRAVTSKPNRSYKPTLRGLLDSRNATECSASRRSSHGRRAPCWWPPAMTGPAGGCGDADSTPPACPGVRWRCWDWPPEASRRARSPSGWSSRRRPPITTSSTSHPRWSPGAMRVCLRPPGPFSLRSCRPARDPARPRRREPVPATRRAGRSARGRCPSAHRAPS